MSSGFDSNGARHIPSNDASFFYSRITVDFVLRRRWPRCVLDSHAEKKNAPVLGSDYFHCFTGVKCAADIGAVFRFWGEYHVTVNSLILLGYIMLIYS